MLKSQRPLPPTCQTPLSLRIEPHAANHSAEQPSAPGGPHKLVRSSFARHSFTHAAGCRVAGKHMCFDGQAVNGRVLAARAQESSVGIADRWLATCYLARADSSRARSGSSLRVTPVRRGAYGCLVERSERSESHLRSRDRRTSDQGHRGRCPTDQSRPWGRMRGTRGAID